MKRKYYGLIAVCIIFASICASVVHFFGVHGKARAIETIPFVQAPSLAVPGPGILSEVIRLQRSLDDLIQLSEQDASPVDLTLFGYNIPGPLNSSDQKKEEYVTSEPAPITFDYSLSFTFVSDQKRYCMIDGKFFHEGAELPDNGKIENIKMKQVLINKQGVENWVYLTTAGSTD